MESRPAIILAADYKGGQRTARALRKAGITESVIITATADFKNKYIQGMMAVIDYSLLQKEFHFAGITETFSDYAEAIKKNTEESKKKNRKLLQTVQSLLLNETGLPLPVLVWSDSQTVHDLHSYGIITSGMKKKELKLAVALAYEKAELQKELSVEAKKAWEILNCLPDALITTDTDGEIMYANHAVSDLTGLSVNEMIFRPVTDVIRFSTDEENRYFSDMVRTVIEEKSSFQSEDMGSAESAKGFRRRISLSVTPLQYNHGNNGFLLLFKDITTWKTAEERLKLASRVIESSSEGIVITDPDRKIIVINDAYCRMTGYSHSDLTGKDTSQIFSYDEYPSIFFINIMKMLIDTGHWAGEAKMLRKNGDTFPAAVRLSVIRNDQGKITNFVGLISDITERKRDEERLRFLANNDPLTGILNRNAFFERLTHALKMARRTSRKAAVLFMDLDFFKKINDTMGHHAGDLLLKNAAERIRSCLRETDSLARFGGDEFTVLLESINAADDSLPTAKRIAEKLSEPFFIEDHTLYISTSIGISIYPDHGTTPDVLLKNADMAMYAAKQQGRNQYRFYSYDLLPRMS